MKRIRKGCGWPECTCDEQGDCDIEEEVKFLSVTFIDDEGQQDLDLRITANDVKWIRRTEHALHATDKV